MSKEQWFRYYERVQAAHPELPDALAAEVARDWMIEDQCERADLLRKAEQENKP